MNDRLSVLIVNYNGGELLSACLESLLRDPATAEAEAILVDNASSDGSAQEAARRFERVRLLALDENRGFGAANNAGIALCTTPYVLMMNPDTEIDEGSVDALLDAMDRSPQRGLVGCRLVGPDRRLQQSIRNFPTVGREAFECLFLHRAFPKLTTRLADVVQPRAEYESARACEWVSGAVMLARTEALRDVGGFDEGFFLYSEEIDLCKRLMDAGWAVWYDPALTVAHVGGSYSVDPRLALENERSKLRYFLKHEGRARMLAFAVVIVARFSIRTALWAAAGRIRGDSRRRERARAAASVLRAYPSLLREFWTMPRPQPFNREGEGEPA